MIVVPINPNSVYVSMVPSKSLIVFVRLIFWVFVRGGCCRSSFDSTYPAQLHGLIRFEEYQESIANINRSFKSRNVMLILLAVFSFCLLAGIGLVIGGLLTMSKSTRRGFPVPTSIGLAVFFLGLLIISIGSCFLQARLMNRLRAAIAAESAKYSSRSPTSCSWRLDITTSATGYGNNRRAIRIYHVSTDYSDRE